MNSNDQEVISIVLDIYFFSKSRQCSYYLTFTLNPIYQMLNSFYSTKHLYIHFGLLPQQHSY